MFKVILENRPITNLILKVFCSTRVLIRLNAGKNSKNIYFNNFSFSKMEVQKLRNDFNLMLSKYSNLENSNMELNSSFNSLKNQSATNERLKEYEIKSRERIDIPA